MIFSLLSDPVFLVIWLVAILFALTVHEFCHALAGSLLGDSTAKDSGRLTLNPLAHVSWIGFLMLLFAGFGWGKPVPFNPYNLKYPRFGPAIVALAGPFSNLLSAILFIIVFKLIYPALHPLFIILNTGSLGADVSLLAMFLSLLIFINIILMLFNLIPVPPLDGSKVLFSIIDGDRFESVRNFLDDQGPMILIIFLVMDNFMNLGILSAIFGFVIEFLYKLLA